MLKVTLERWTEEIFKISKIQLTIPVTYKITDYNGEEIQGSFYEQELQKTSQKNISNLKGIKQTRREISSKMDGISQVISFLD